jgi:two-component system cell cycle sensor histidine kinase/response regulator CckA
MILASGAGEAQGRTVADEGLMTTMKRPGEDNGPIVERGVRPAVAFRVVLLAVVLAASAGAFIVFKNQLDNELVLGVLGVLAMAGIFFVVSALIGLVEFMPQATGSDDLARSFLDSHPDGTVVTDRKGRIVYANTAYGALTGAQGNAEVQTLETLLSRNRDATESVYRLTNGLHEGKEGAEEFRVQKPLNASGANGSGAQWYRLKARILPNRENAKQPLYIWQISNITSERDDQERFFKELQNAIDYLDHAPAGFFSAGRKGEIVYLNATLCRMARHRSRQVPAWVADRLPMSWRARGMALIQSVPGRSPARNARKSLDLDLRKTNGQSLPVRMVHQRLFHARRGARREPHHRSDAREEGGRQRYGVRVDRRHAFHALLQQHADGDRLASTANGRILRTNAPFLKLFSGVVSRDDIDRGAKLETIVHDTDRLRLQSGAGRCRQGPAGRHSAAFDSLPSEPMTAGISASMSTPSSTRSDEAPEEAAIVYAVEITEQKRARDADGADAEDECGRHARRRHRARLQQRADGDPALLRPSVAVRHGLPMQVLPI